LEAAHTASGASSSRVGEASTLKAPSSGGEATKTGETASAATNPEV
jgi:hypothetical protein